ncbi:MAG: hypothetical protein ABSB15_14985 [Bryobacteraceae bacterium]
MQTVQVFVNTFFEERRAQLLSLAGLVEKSFASAGLEYRIAGGLAAHLYAEEVDPDAGRLTKDIDIVVRREDLQAIAQVVEPFGLQYRHAAGVDMLLQAGAPSGRRAVHMMLENELGPCRSIRGIRLVPLIDLVRMKLTSFRLKDQMHLKDLDELGLITSEMETELIPIQRERLADVRSRE